MSRLDSSPRLCGTFLQRDFVAKCLEPLDQVADDVIGRQTMKVVGPPVREKLHVHLRQFMLPVRLRDGLDHRAAARAIHAPHALQKKHQRAPHGNELEPPFFQMIVPRPALLAPRAGRIGTDHGSHAHLDPLLVRREACPFRRQIRERDNTGLESSSVPWRSARGRRNPRTVSQAPPPSQAARSLDRLPFCKDLHEWPRRWMGFAEDVPPGDQIVACFRPFLNHLHERQLSPKTFRKHVNNLWVLGATSSVGYTTRLVETGADRRSGL
jgi:hypothetical protein